MSSVPLAINKVENIPSASNGNDDKVLSMLGEMMKKIEAIETIQKSNTQQIEMLVERVNGVDKKVEGLNQRLN